MSSQASLPGIEHATIIERDEHNISRKDISPSALKVLYRLQEHGFGAFLVGGGVRDLLLGMKPKDFDIATDATPEELRDLFGNARMIGRRFKIVHIRFGREIIEVTTFRAPHDTRNEIEDGASRRNIRNLDSAHSRSGMILRDNVYGNIDEDAWRRDFTVNALYYTIDGFRVLDFCDGLTDLDEGQLRIIGDPEERYREDPVRMLRAIRFAAKLDFDIEPQTEEPIDRLAILLASISPARLFDETLKLMISGHAVRSFDVIRRYEVARFLFEPTLEAMEECDDAAYHLVGLALENTDDRLADGKSVTPAFLFAALLWPPLKLRLDASEDQSHGTFQKIANEVIMDQLQYTAIPKRFTFATKEIWELQRRLTSRSRRVLNSVFNHPRFRAAYDFLLLREDAGEDLGGVGDWWTDFQDANEDERDTMISAVAEPEKKKRRRRRRKSGNSQ